MPLLQVQTLLQHPVAVSDQSFVPHPRLRRRHRHRKLPEDGHSVLIQRCGVGTHFNLSYLLEDSCIANSRIVPPCHTVPISPLLHYPPLPRGVTLSTPAMSTLATSC